jgi:hypothetical protein
MNCVARMMVLGGAGGLDQLLLDNFGPEIAVFGRAIGSDDGERNMMADTCRLLCREKVAPRGFEEFQHRLVFK